MAERTVLGPPESGSTPATGVSAMAPLGLGEESGPIYARICDAACTKPWAQAPVGNCSGLCKKHGDAYGNHSESHVCNTCGYSW
jgi:hypothetical protein